MSKEYIETLKAEEKANQDTDLMSDEKVYGFLGGSVVILMGLAFLAAINFGFSMGQVWPIVFFVPIGAMTFKTVRSIRNGEGVDMSSVIGVLSMVLIASVWFFNLNWGNIWPIFMIFGGLYALSNTLQDKK